MSIQKTKQFSFYIRYYIFFLSPIFKANLISTSIYAYSYILDNRIYFMFYQLLNCKILSRVSTIKYLMT